MRVDEEDELTTDQDIDSGAETPDEASNVAVRRSVRIINRWFVLFWHLSERNENFKS